MRTPHTQYPKGAKVWIRKKNGNIVVGRFKERKSTYLIITIAGLGDERVDRADIAGMSYFNHNG